MGQTVSIVCHSQSKVTWSKDEIILLEEENEDKSFVGTTLVIHDVKENDAGQYNCMGIYSANDVYEPFIATSELLVGGNTCNCIVTRAQISISESNNCDYVLIKQHRRYYFIRLAELSC